MFLRAHGARIELPEFIPESMLESAIVSGNTNLIDILVAPYNESLVISLAAKYNLREVVQWAVDRGYTWGMVNTHIPDLEFLRWIESLGFESSNDTIYSAMANNRLDIVKAEIRNEVHKRMFINKAFATGTIEIIQWFDVACIHTKEYLRILIGRGDVDILRQLSFPHNMIKKYHMMYAMRSRSLEMVKYVYGLHNDWYEDDLYYLNQYLSIDISLWLISIGVIHPLYNKYYAHADLQVIKNSYDGRPISYDAIIKFLKAGRLDVIMWIYEIGIMPDNLGWNIPIVYACESNNLELIQWLHSIGQRITPYIADACIFNAVNTGNIKIVSWILQFANMHIDYPNAVRKGRINIIQLLLKRGIVVNFNVPNLIPSPEIACIMRERGCKLNVQTYFNDQSSNVKLWYECGAPLEFRVFTYYVKSDRPNELKWLLENTSFYMSHEEKHSLVNLTLCIANNHCFAVLLDAGFPLSHRNYRRGAERGGKYLAAIIRRNERRSAMKKVKTK